MSKNIKTKSCGGSAIIRFYRVTGSSPVKTPRSDDKIFRDFQGNIDTDFNINIQGTAVIYGNLYIGTCTNVMKGSYDVDANLYPENAVFTCEAKVCKVEFTEDVS